MVQFSAAGYDSLVAGIDELSARTALAEMQDRLATDPVSALGVATGATVEDVRAAFLELTKTYHPVRFGRMATDIQKMSNEVFLALRAAHDALAKTARRRSGPMPTLRPPSAVQPPVTPASTAPTAAPPPHPTARATQPAARSGRPGSPNDTGERPVPPIPGTPPTAKPAGAKPAAPQAPAPQPAARAAPLRATGSGATSPVRDEAAILELLQNKQWDQARSALHQLSARDPSSKKIRALMCYARGREAQLGGQLDDARVELQDALDLDPDLQLAKTALTELFTRRK